MKRLYLLAAIMVIAASGCDRKVEKAEDNKKENIETVKVEENKPADYYGTYEGTLPCADCEGIKTTLKINDDTTYELRSEYLGKKDGTFEESGVYRIVSGDVIELITPSSGDKTYYKILDGAVTMSDSTGVTAQGALADQYTLKKK